MKGAWSGKNNCPNCKVSCLKNIKRQLCGSGGDWNHRLIKTDFPTTTEEKFLFWIHNLPEDFTPNGWQWALDENVPTVRTLEHSYIINEKL